MKAALWAAIFLAAAPVLAAAGPEARLVRDAPVDLAPALRIGEFTASRYLFDKAWNQFTSAVTRRSGRPPGREERAQWFRLYAAQQLIKADLVAQGHLERPEVTDMTERMTRYMLTQPRGTLYRELGGADPVAFRHERRAKILRACGFQPFPGAIARLWPALAPAFARAELPAEADVAALGPAILAEYSVAGEARRLTALDFVRDFRRGIARLAPHDAASLGEQVGDIVLAEHDLREAKARGFDQTAQFLQDRLNFALNQMLALHEQEVLARQVVVSPAELSARYEADVLRRKTGGVPPAPPERARVELQRQLVREKVEALELDHLARHAGRVQLEVDLAAYGLDALQLDRSPL